MRKEIAHELADIVDPYPGSRLPRRRVVLRHQELSHRSGRTGCRNTGMLTQMIGKKSPWALDQQPTAHHCPACTACLANNPFSELDRRQVPEAPTHNSCSPFATFPAACPAIIAAAQRHDRADCHDCSEPTKCPDLITRSGHLCVQR